jgi:hypothetical protein
MFAFPWHVVAWPAPPPSMLVKVINAVDVYDRPDPPPDVQAKLVDGLDPANTVLVTLIAVGPDNWYQVSWNGCPPQPNWVYSGPGDVPSILTRWRRPRPL